MSPEEISIIRLSSLIASIFSIFGTLFVLMTFFFLKVIRQIPTFKFVIGLTISDFILTITGMIEAVPYTNNQTEDVLCEIAGAFNEYSRLSSLLWTAVFAYSLYSVVKSKALDMGLFSKAIWLCYACPLVISIVPLIMNMYGNAVMFCWIKQLSDPTTALLLDSIFFYGWFPLILVINTFFYIKAINILKNSKVSSESTDSFYQLLFYPVVLCACWTLGFVDRFYMAISGGDLIFLRLAHVVMIQLQGFFNAMIYGMNFVVRNAIKERVRDLFHSSTHSYETRPSSENLLKRESSNSSQNWNGQKGKIDF